MCFGGGKFDNERNENKRASVNLCAEEELIRCKDGDRQRNQANVRLCTGSVQRSLGKNRVSIDGEIRYICTDPREKETLVRTPYKDEYLPQPRSNHGTGAKARSIVFETVRLVFYRAFDLRTGFYGFIVNILVVTGFPCVQLDTSKKMAFNHQAHVGCGPFAVGGIGCF